MRKLGMLFALIAAATLGFAGTAHADGHEDTLGLCSTIDGATQPAIDGGVPTPKSQDGLVESCLKSNSTDGIVAGPLLCGISADMIDSGQTPFPEIGQGLDDLREELEGTFNSAPLDVTGCDPDPDPNGDDDDNQGDDDDDNDDVVKSNNATPDGGLPRTGGELFAGAGLGLAGLGAFLRRFFV